MECIQIACAGMTGCDKFEIHGEYRPQLPRRVPLADNLFTGIIPVEIIDLVRKGLNYEKDVQGNELFSKP